MQHADGNPATLRVSQYTEGRIGHVTVDHVIVMAMLLEEGIYVRDEFLKIKIGLFGIKDFRAHRLELGFVRELVQQFAVMGVVVQEIIVDAALVVIPRHGVHEFFHSPCPGQRRNDVQHSNRPVHQLVPFLRSFV